MKDSNYTTLVWDNIPEWAIFALEYGIEEELFLTDEDLKMISGFHYRKSPERVHDERGLEIIQGI